MPISLSRSVKHPVRQPAKNLAGQLRQTRQLLQAALLHIDSVLADAAPRHAQVLRSAAPAQPKSGEADLAALRAALGWTRAFMASVLHCSERALVNWEQGEAVSAVYAVRARELERLYLELARLMKPGEVGSWLNTALEEFDHRSPADLLRHGESGRLWESIYFLRSGQPD